MKQFITAFAASLFVAIASISFSMQANAASYIDYKSLKSSAHSSSFLIQSAHYVRGSYYDEDEDDYGDEDYYDDEDDYYPRKNHRHKYNKRKRCYTEYVSKYVCEQPEPRCLRQRECIWSYGKEYCRYVRKCSRTEKTCNYIKVPKRRCW